MKYEKELLNLYISNSEYRRNIQVPFRQDGRICATDDNMMIRIDESLCEGEYTDTPNGLKAPNTSSVIPRKNMCETVTARMLNDALDKAPEEKERRCPECVGSGNVVYEYHDRLYYKHTIEGDCPECDGTGEAYDYAPIKCQFTIFGHALCYYHLTVLLRTMDYLQTQSLRLRHVQKDEDITQAILFDVDGKNIEILVMPQLRGDSLKLINIMD